MEIVLHLTLSVFKKQMVSTVCVKNWYAEILVSTTSIFPHFSDSESSILFVNRNEPVLYSPCIEPLSSEVVSANVLKQLLNRFINYTD